MIFDFCRLPTGILTLEHAQQNFFAFRKVLRESPYVRASHSVLYLQNIITKRISFMTVIRQYAKSWSPSSHQSIPKNISLGLALTRASAIQELEEEFFREIESSCVSFSRISATTSFLVSSTNVSFRY